MANVAPVRILAGDVGGTKTNLAVFECVTPGDRRVVREASFPSREFASLESVTAAFLAAGERVDAAAFGIAGPVIDGAVATTNLPWRITPSVLSLALGGARVRLLNDLETTALGAIALPQDRYRTLQAGVARSGNVAVIAAGTGLGQAFLYWDGQRHLPAATEGGHADFAPTTGDDVRLLQFAQSLYGHVSWERLVSGPGLHLLFRFLTERGGRVIDPAVRDQLAGGVDPSAAIGAAGLDASCDTCREAVDWFVRLYGTQAGNLALSVMALGGVLIGGGIVGKLLPRIEVGGFMTAFTAKGRYQGLLEGIPVRAVLEPKASLLGAADAAFGLLLPA